LGVFGELVQVHERQLFKRNHPRARAIGLEVELDFV